MIALTGLKADRDELDRSMKDRNNRFTGWALSKRLGSTQEDKLKAYPLDKKTFIQYRLEGRSTGVRRGPCVTRRVR